jgi:hypothetical protein
MAKNDTKTAEQQKNHEARDPSPGKLDEYSNLLRPQKGQELRYENIVC